MSPLGPAGSNESARVIIRVPRRQPRQSDRRMNMSVTASATSSAVVGRPKLDLDTPALCVDLDIMDRNLKKMAGRILGAGKNWRPHTKGQKIPALAHKEILARAMGVTCAKLGEAEVMAGAGIRDILIANQVVGHEKVTRLANIQPHADVMVAIDSRENAREISDAAVAKGV